MKRVEAKSKALVARLESEERLHATRRVFDAIVSSTASNSNFNLEDPLLVNTLIGPVDRRRPARAEINPNSAD